MEKLLCKNKYWKTYLFKKNFVKREKELQISLKLKISFILTKSQLTYKNVQDTFVYVHDF